MNSTRIGIIKGNNQPVATRGLLTTTAGPDLLHTIPLRRTFIIRKVMYYNNTGADVTLILGTQTNAGVWVPLLPTFRAINGFNDWEDLPDVEFVNDRTAGAGGVTGNALVQASAAGVLVRLLVEEFGV
jgi:hypothetical protein